MTFDVEIAKLVVAVLGFGGTITALYFGYRQYKRAEQWKRAEFVAKEIKEFESDPVVRNVFQMIDWGERRVNLFLRADIQFDQFEKVTREDQWRALLPHRLKPYYPSSKVDENVAGEKKYTSEETKIRDSYDVFLDYLQRFGNFVEAGLVSEKELRPYLSYWLESMAYGDSKQDVLWRCALLSYINYYKFAGVVKLFSAFEIDILPGGKVFADLEKKMHDHVLYQALQYLIKEDLYRKAGDDFESFLHSCKASELTENFDMSQTIEKSNTERAAGNVTLPAPVVEVRRKRR